MYRGVKMDRCLKLVVFIGIEVFVDVIEFKKGLVIVIKDYS